MQPYYKGRLSNVLWWEYSLDLKTTFANFSIYYGRFSNEKQYFIFSDVPKHFPLRGGGASIT